MDYLVNEQFCSFWYAVSHRNIVAVIMTMRAITYQWSRNFVSFSSFLLVVAIDKLYRDTKKISTNSQLYNPNLSALIILTGRKLELCAICFEKRKRSDVPRIFFFLPPFYETNLMVLYVIAFSELLLLCLALLQLVQGPLKQTVFLNFTIVKKCLNPYPNYDWNLIWRLDIFHWNQYIFNPVSKSTQNCQFGQKIWILTFFDVNKTSIFTMCRHCSHFLWNNCQFFSFKWKYYAFWWDINRT